MLDDKITTLLSNHRHPNNSAIPQTLTKQQIISLISASTSPNCSTDKLNIEMNNVLNELQAQGEILAGKRNSHCMAPPMVLAKNKDDLTTLLFRGDRAYLTLAHKVLESEKNPHKPLVLRPKSKFYHRIKDRLSQIGIRLLMISDSIEHLPQPRKPLKSELRSNWLEDPFNIKNWQNGSYIQRYISCNKTQKERWFNPSRESIKSEDILRLPTGEYLWYEEQNFYELEPDVAILAMFYQDKQMEYPLEIIWDEPPGKLNLQGVYLPSTYTRWLWHISEPGEEYRTRQFEPNNWSFVKEVFTRLGAKLV